MGVKAVEAVNAIVVKKQPASSVANGRYLFMDAVLVDASNVKQFLK
jgi:simple sugar transport system substrate-binding protein/ribose transport system substrate-binding protein